MIVTAEVEEADSGIFVRWSLIVRISDWLVRMYLLSRQHISVETMNCSTDFEV